MSNRTYFSRETLPADMVLMVVKAADGNEFACMIRRDNIPLIEPACIALLDVLDDYEGGKNLQ